MNIANDHLLCGIDLGGTKIEGVVVESTDPSRAIIRKRINTESEQGYAHVLSKIKALYFDLVSQAESPLPRVGVAHPGTVDPISGVLRNSNSQCLNGEKLIFDLQRDLGARVIGANDANCFAIAEAQLGAGRGASTVFGVIMGTGVGGGLVIDGKVIYGKQGIGGEWGHNVVLEGGDSCYCNKRGCVETVISGPALERFYASHSNKAMALKDIVASVDADPVAAKTVERLIRYFGQGLSQVINIFDPDVIVLGGGVSNVKALYEGGIESVKQYIFSPKPLVDLRPNQLGDSAGVFGAALLAAERLNKKRGS